MPDEPAPFSLVTQPLAAEAALCRMGGRMDSHACEVIEDEFGKLLAAGMKAVVLEMSALEDMTSAGLGAVVNMSRTLEGKGGVLVLTLLRPGVEGLLDMLGVKEGLTVADGMDAARKRIAAVQQQQ